MIMRLRIYNLKQFPANSVGILWNLGVLIKRTLVKSSILTLVYAFRDYTVGRRHHVKNGAGSWNG